MQGDGTHTMFNEISSLGFLFVLTFSLILIDSHREERRSVLSFFQPHPVFSPKGLRGFISLILAWHGNKEITRWSRTGWVFSRGDVYVFIIVIAIVFVFTPDKLVSH